MKVKQKTSLSFDIDGHNVLAHSDGFRCWGKECGAVRDCLHSNEVLAFLLRKQMKGEKLRPKLRETIISHVAHIQWRIDKGYHNQIEGLL